MAFFVIIWFTGGLRVLKFVNSQSYEPSQNIEHPTLHSVWPPPQPENHKLLRHPLKKRQHHAFPGQTEPRARKGRASRKSGVARKGKA